MSPLTSNILIFLISLLNWTIFAALEALGGGVQRFFEIQNQRNNVREFNLHWNSQVFAHRPMYQCRFTQAHQKSWKSPKISYPHQNTSHLSIKTFQLNFFGLLFVGQVWTLNPTVFSFANARWKKWEDVRGEGLTCRNAVEGGDARGGRCACRPFAGRRCRRLGWSRSYLVLGRFF